MQLLSRLRSGHLFLLAIPGDAAASETEIADAALSAKLYSWPAYIVISVIWVLLASAWDRAPNSEANWAEYRTQLWRMRWILGLFVIGTVADIATTLAFFHRDGVDQELHPGIRLVSYALGRSIGPIVTKLIQFAGVLLIASVFRRAAPYLLAAAGATFLLGALYNVWLSCL